jgi:hypothetical protein
VVAGKDNHAALRGHDALGYQLLADALLRWLDGCRAVQARFGALVHHKPLGGVFAHAICPRAFAVEQLFVPLAGGRVAQRLKNRLTQRGQQGGGGLVDLVAVGL